MSTTPEIDLREFRAALARHGLPQWRLAASLGVCPSSLSAYLHGHTPAPPDLAERIDHALGTNFSNEKENRNGDETQTP